MNPLYHSEGLSLFGHAGAVGACALVTSNPVTASMRLSEPITFADRGPEF